ncbi:MAG: hypothetical protein R3F59_35610 [Myxococcota bacterium]
MAHALQARDVGQQALRDGRQPGDLLLLELRQRMPVVEALGGVARQGDEAELRQHRGHLDPPAVGQAQVLGDLARQLLEAVRPAERDGVGERQHVDQRLDAAVERLLEQHPLRRHELVLLRRRLHRGEERRRRAGLREEAEDLALVDGGDGRADVGLAGEQDAHGVGRLLARVGEERGAVHAGHAHVRHDDGGVGVLGEPAQRLGAGGRGGRLIAPTEVEHQPVEHVGLVVDAQHLGSVLHGWGLQG